MRHSVTVGDCVFDVDGDVEMEYDAEPERDTDTVADSDANVAVDETLGLIEVEYVTLGDGDSEDETVDEGHIVYVPVTEKDSEFVIVPLPDQETVAEPLGLVRPDVVTDNVPVIEFVADTVDDRDDVNDAVADAAVDTDRVTDPALNDGLYETDGEGVAVPDCEKHALDVYDPEPDLVGVNVALTEDVVEPDTQVDIVIENVPVTDGDPLGENEYDDVLDAVYVELLDIVDDTVPEAVNVGLADTL